MRSNFWAWLLVARDAGYEQGFSAAPDKYLEQLEALGYLERNPTTDGATTQWRITEAGIARLKLPQRRLWVV